MSKKPALGKGLHSLLPARSQSRPTPEPEAALDPAPAPAVAEPRPVTELPIDDIRANPHQPRKEFRQQQLLELALSITADGIIQPLVVRSTPEGYELVAGERRLRAAKIAGLATVPVVVQEIKNERLLEIALIENIQREDLNPIELASAFERMSNELNLNHEEIGSRTGKDRATITNAIRLLQLPTEVQALLAAQQITPGHGRALLKLRTPEEQIAAAKMTIQDGLSVRQLEEWTKPAPAASQKPPVEEKPIDPNVRAAISEMERALGTRVRIAPNKKQGGMIQIEYYSAEDLDRIYAAIAKD